MPTVGTKPARVQMVALIRDKNGKPRIDDPENIPPAIFNLLTQAEKEALKNGDHTRNSNTK